MRLVFLTAALSLGALPLAAQDYHFTKAITAGGTVEIGNITGDVEVTRASGRTAEVSVRKTVKHGDGNLVKAVMETGADGGMHVCTVYLRRSDEARGCDGDDNHDDGSHRGNRLEVDMHYTVTVPAGAKVEVDDVNGNVTVTGIDSDGKIETVNGNVVFNGPAGASLSTVNGTVTATFTRAGWTGELHVESVNGAVNLTFPADFAADVSGETVNGAFSSDFPIRVEKGWGPKSFSGRIGQGGPRLTIETVNGGITLRKR